MNLATGNLILQAQDEQLLFRGMAIGQVRTYNSQGRIDQVGQDAWMTGFERRVELLSGALNEAGSVIRRHLGDGSTQDFEYVAPNLYRSTAGEGAHDTLTWDGSNRAWSYQEGSTRRVEIYEDHADAILLGRLTRIRDMKSDGTAPVTWSVQYDGNGRVSEVRAEDGTATGDALVFGYDGSGRLSTVSTRESGVVRGQVSYGYDSVGRLASVITDLTPEDRPGDRDSWDASVAANNDGYLFRTDYTYADATSLRITQVRQSDGTLISYTYDSEGRIATLTRGDSNADDSDGVGQTLSFTYDPGNHRANVIDSSGRTWTYDSDGDGRLVNIDLPAGAGGLRAKTSYTYDADGNVTRVETTRGSTTLARTDYQYDAHGNVLWQWEVVDPSQGGAARAVQRTYTSTHQLASETVFTGLDPDGANSAQAPTGGQTTRYVYDAQDRLRFAIGATGDVRELSYAGSGSGIGQIAQSRQYLGAGYSGSTTLSALEAWATPAQRASSTLVQNMYDLQGRLSRTVAYARVDTSGNGIEEDAASITDYVYDAQGLLRQQVERRSSTATVDDGRDTAQTTAYAYDGMGRLLSEVVTEQVGSGPVTTLRTTVWSYVDSAMTVSATVEGGVAGDGSGNDLLRLQVRNAAGQVVSTIESALTGGTTTHTTRSYYDDGGRLRAREDASGARTYYFYDAEERLVGEVDATGAVTVYSRDGLGRVVTTTGHATRVDTSSWLAGGQVVPTDIQAVKPATHADDRRNTATYDAQGRLLTAVDAEGGITTYSYDGAGRLVQTRMTDAAGTAASARVTRYFHDAAGREVARLDAEGYLVEYSHDRAGRVVRTVAYATATSQSLRASGTLANLRPVGHANDQVTRIFHDGRGNRVAELNAEGYLTEYVFDEARNERAVRAYARQLTGLAGNESLAALRTQVQAGAVRETRRSFDALGNLLIEVNPEGTVTRYSYDVQGRLLRSEAAQGTSEVREGRLRYDVFGNLIGELGGEGATHLLSGMSEAQLDAVYAQYGMRHSYDARGQRIESVDAQGNKTWYFYDAVGRLTFTVRGVANAQGVANAEGEVTETRYTAFGEVREAIAYTGRITIGVPGSRDSAGAAVSVLQYVAATDSRTTLAYDRRGLVKARIDAENYRTEWRYSAFGDLIEQIDVARGVSTGFAYDRRGLRTAQVDDQGGLSRTVGWAYDAFGRVTSATDGRGHTVTFGYDRLGRQVTESQVVSGRTQGQSIGYDAFGRVLTQTDALGRITTYAYDDAARSMAITTPEGVTLTTHRNRHGETSKVVDALGHATEYRYDRDGHLLEARAADGGTSVSEYDVRGLLASTVDATGRRVDYRYDATGRLLKRIEDPAGLNRATTYAYDGQGRQVSVTDSAGIRTTFGYDRKGQLRETVRDAAGLALKTVYTWDAQGRQLTVTEGAGTAAATKLAYAYDALGRRTNETVDPGAGKLNLTTTYTYDGNDNLVSRTDAEGRVTRFSYDEANREVFRVDGAGGVVRTWYDVEGRVVATRGYAQAINLDGLGLAATISDIQGRVTTQHGKDIQSYRVHDADGRLKLSIDGAGAVTEVGYDAAGRQVSTRRYANAVSLTSLRSALQGGTATPASVASALTVDNARDRTSYVVLDAVGRVRFTVEADGAVLEQRYDLAGRATQSWAYATALSLSAADRAALAAGTFQATTLASRVAPQASAARAQYIVYDTIGRERYRVERSSADKGVVSERVYDAGGLVVADRRFGVEVAFDPTHTIGDLAALLPPSGDDAVMRRTRYVYDTAGRLRFEIGASNAVTESRYDASGRVVETIAHSAPKPAGTPTEAGMAAWSQAQPAEAVRSTRFTYDAAGRLKQRTDALDQVEKYTYDGTGQVVAYTDRNGHVWNYEYDAAGRKTREISPQASVATVNAAGNVATVSRRLTTEIGYDALGNVVSRTENAGTAEARTTQYAYDNRGHQIRTTFPDAWKVNETTGELEATGQAPTIQVTYNTLGQAVVQKDVRGHYSYKVHDQLGRVAYEVDQEGYVTGYGYNALGEQVTLRRHATRIDTGALSGWSAGQALTLSHLQTSGVLTTSTSDRILSTSYDARGNKAQVVQSQVSYYNAAGSKLTGTPTTRFTYSAFGEVVKESVLLEGTAGQSSARWADTFHYYDALSRNVLTVDAEGYATATRYNATGEVVETIEHARALDTDGLAVDTQPSAPPPGDAVTGYDRIMRWEYDALGRKVSEVAVRRYQRADGSAGVRGVETAFAYDGEGRVTRLTTDAGATITRYDALGRAISVQEPERAVLTASAENSLKASTANDLSTAGLYQQVSPYTAMAYDAFGNVVQIRRYANGLKAGQSAPVADTARDQIQVTRYDRQGRAVMSKDAEGNFVYSAYDAADNLVHVWYQLEGSATSRDTIVHGRYSYDKTGRQVGNVQTRTPVSGGTGSADLSEAVEYNAFGEITRKTQTGLGGSLDYAYDAAGRLLTSNEGGATRTLGYNLAGHQVRQSSKAYLGQSQVVDAVTWNTTDRLGRAVITRMPAYNAANDPVVVTQRLDRWGNAIEIIDGRGYQTRYQYNDYNQIVRDERPLVKVVSESGASTWVHPVNQWYYDALGRLVATRDANGNVRTNEYDNAGQLVKSTDALGNATRHAYDVLGNQRMAQDPMGYLTFKEYDRLNRVVAIGDYLPDASGAVRGKTLLQQYTLNQNGDRLRVEDALGYIARYDYDSRSLLLRSQTTMGVVLDFAHDVAGNKIRESNAFSGSSTLTDRDGETVRVNELTWDYDIHGRVVDHNNLSGRDYDYTYNALTGQLTAESSAGGSGLAMPAAASKSISYYANGRIKEVVEGNGNKFRYEYDAAGNRTVEDVIFTDGSGQQTRTITRTLYDSHNRVERVTQDDLSAGSAKRVFDMVYEYDAVGNRRRVVARSGFGPDVAAVPVENTAPVSISTPEDRVVRKGVKSEFRILFSDVFRDAQQDPLTLLVSQANGSALPTWLRALHDSTTGEIVFIADPPSGASDQDITVKLTAHETANAANTASTTFKVKVRTNTAPVLVESGTAQLRAKTGQMWSQELVVTDYFRDLDVGDRLTLSIVNAAALPAWLQVDAGNPSVVRLTGTPTTSDTFSFKLRATDEKGAYVEKTFQVTTAPNAAPQKVVSSLIAQEAIRGRDFDWTRNLSQIFKDNDGDRLQVTASGQPAWLSFQYLDDQATPQMKLAGHVPVTVANGTAYTITFTATDPDGLSATITLSVTVRQNRAPVATNWTAPPTRVNDHYDVTVPVGTLFNDPEGDQVFIEPIWPTGSTLPQWLNISVDQDAGTIRLHGRPTSNAQAGNLSFQLRGSDAEGLGATANVSISIGTDNPPVRNTSVNLADRSLDIGRSFSFTVPANLFTDPDEDQVHLQPSLVEMISRDDDDVPIPDSVNYLPLPAWLHFDGNRTFSGTVPSELSPGKIVIRIKGVDSRDRVSAADEYNIGAAGVGTDGDITLHLNTFVNAPPVYNDGSLPNRTIKHGTAVDFALPAGAFTEPNGDDLTYAAQVLVGGNWVSLSSIGLSINSSTGRISGTPSNLIQTSFSARIIASDPQGLPATGTFTFNVTNTPPTVATIPVQTVSRNIAANLDLAPYFNDVNKDTLTYSVVSGLPSGLSLSGSGKITGSTGVALGDYTVKVKASDGRGGSVEATFTLRVSNKAPVAPTIPNQTAAAGTSWSYTIPAFTDPNGDELTYQVNEAALPSWMSFNKATRKLSGTPGPVGSWTVTVTASDGTATANRSFVVSTPNVAPVVSNPIANRDVSRNVNWSFTVPANTFTDANGDRLTYLASGMPTGITFDQDTRKFSGKATALGSRVVTVTVQDEHGATRSTTFTISVVNDPPKYTAGSLPNRTAQIGQSVSWALPSGAFTDPNSDPLSYSLQVLVPEYYEHYRYVNGEPELRLVPAQWVNASRVGLSIASNGTISGTAGTLSWRQTADDYPYPMPDGVAYGYSLRIVAKDPSNASAQGAFTLAVNAAPVAPSLPNKSIKSGLAWSYDFPAFTDANGDTLTYTVTGLPAGLSHPGGTSRRISGTPTASGTFTVKITADDGNGGKTIKSFTLTVQANTAPSAPTIPNQTATKGQPFSYTVPAFTDANNDPLTYTATGLPPGLSFNVTTRVISGTPTTTGTYSNVKITADDKRGGVTPKTFTISVVSAPPPNRPPVVNRPLPDQFATTSMYFDYTFPADTFTDPDNNPLTYTLSGQPSWLQIDGRRLHGQPWSTGEQVYTVRVTAKDPSGLSVYDEFKLTVWRDDVDPWSTQSVQSFQMGAALAPEGEDELSAPAMEPMQAPLSGSTPYQTVEQWFSYDAENRIRIHNGALVNGRIVVKTPAVNDPGSLESYELHYDAAGREVSRFRYHDGVGYVYRSAYDLRGQKVLEFHREQLGGSGRGVSKAYTYDVAGRLVETRGYFASDATRRVSYREGAEEIYWDLQIGGWLSGAEQFSFDGDGRLVSQTTRGRPDGDWWQAFGTPLEGPSGNQRTDLGVLDLRSEVLYTKADGSSGYDVLGRLQSYRYRGHDIGWATHTYTSTWQGWGSYQERTVTGSSSNPDYKTTTNTLSYDGMGRLLSQREKTNYDNVDDRMRYYAYTGDGQVQRRREGRIEDGVFRQDDPNQPNNPKPNYLFVHAGGQQHAELKEGGQIRTRYGSRGDQTQLQDLGGSGRYEAGGGKVTVLAGETLRGLAQRVYGTPQLWYVLADANGLGDPDTPLTAGTQLNAPSTRVSSNDANTFKPYNPSEAIGNTAPGLPYITPPPKNNCGTLAMVIMVVVIIVVSIYTAGAASGAAAGAGAGTGGGAAAGGAAAGSTAAAGGTAASTSVWSAGVSAFAGGGGVMTTGTAVMSAGVGAFAGSVAGQAVGSAMGVTSFNWRNAFVAGASAMATAGLGAAIQGGQLGTLGKTLNDATWARAAATAVTGNVTSYAASRALGMEASFSWRSVAASAVSAAISTKLGDAMGLNPTPDVGGSGSFWKDMGNGLIGGTVGLHTRRAFGFGDDINYRNIAADAFGNALGNAAVRRMQRWQGGAATAQGGVNGGVSTTYASGDFGPDPVGSGPSPTAGSAASADRRRSNAIGPIYDPNVPTLDTLVVTADEGQNRWYMSMWDWAQRYHQPGPPTTGNRADLVRYWSDSHQRLAPDYNRWVADSYPAGSLNRTSGPGRYMSVAEADAAWEAKHGAPTWLKRTGGGVVGVIEGAYDLTIGAAVALGRLGSDFVGSGLYEVGMNNGYTRSSYDRLGATTAGVVDLVGKGLMFSAAWTANGAYMLGVDTAYTRAGRGYVGQQIGNAVDALAAPFKLADQYEAAGDPVTAATLRSKAVFTGLGTVATLGYGAASGVRTLGSVSAVDRGVSTAYARSVANSELTIAANAATGNPAAISRGFGALNSRQAAVLEQLPEFGSSTIAHKGFGQRDLAALTAATGDEFAMFSTGGRRLIFRGDVGSVPINPEMASQLSGQGWRWSSHTHPGFEIGVLRSSPGDQAVLRAMGGNQSAIFNSMGQRGMFTPNGDSLNGWKPWW
ncbi:putative Ig domain-containing protein [Marilutibacter alkalisoli]|uniref:putative Ig domain-containing protein n=1 Tax=Marilutibacter alkalisoli TaxID=2591633 RepID=UPI00141E7D77|nr:putative Ig domain-containing protein [Lysobacter alkalisoli]